MNLNLEKLTEEELKHIENVMQRDIRLSAGRTLSPQKLGFDPPPSVIVMSKIKEITGGSLDANLINPESPNHEESSTEENIFSSFAGMIARRLSSDSITNKTDKGKKDNKNMVDEKTGRKRKPFKYNYRETIKLKPTLLQLAMNKGQSPTRTSLPTITLMNKVDIPAHQIRERGNALFSSLPESFYSSKSAEASEEKSKNVTSPDKNPQDKRPTRAANNFSRPLTTNRSISTDSRYIPETIEEVSERMTVPEINLQSPSNEEIFDNNKPYMVPDSLTYYPTEKNGNDDIIFAELDNDEKEYDFSGVDSDFVNLRAEKPEDPMSRATSFSSINSSNFDKRNDGCYFDSPNKSTSKVGYSHSFNSPSPSMSTNGPYHTLPRSPRSPRCPNRSESVPNDRNATLLTPSKTDQRRFSGSTKTLDALSTSTAGSSPSRRSSGASSPCTNEVAQTSNGKSVGNLEISLVYYSSESFKRKVKRTIIPARGTKCQGNCDVLSRNEYVAVTGAKLPLSSKTKSGALPQSDGELHLEIKGAKLVDSAIGKHKSPNTYVKCYLLPDKYHSSKMKTAVLKKTLTPQWDHKFIFVGFSQSDFLERSIEIIISDAHFKKQYILGGVRLSVGRNTATQPWINSSNQEAYVWKTALQMSGNKVITQLPILDNVKPTYL